MTYLGCRPTEVDRQKADHVFSAHSRYMLGQEEPALKSLTDGSAALCIIHTNTCNLCRTYRMCTFSRSVDNRLTNQNITGQIRKQLKSMMR